MDCLVEYVVLVGQAGSEQPRVLRRLPRAERRDTPFPAAGFGALALPADSGSQSCSSESYTAVLQQADGTRIYMVILAWHRSPGRRKALCLLSRWPQLAPLHAALRCLRLAMIQSPAATIAAVRTLLRAPVPLPGVAVQVSVGGLELVSKYASK